MIQVVELSDKNFKIIMTNMLKCQEEKSRQLAKRDG